VPTYRITVDTGDMGLAGTDANVFITLFGPAGATDELMLDTQRNNFEQNSTDVFSIDTQNDLGALQRVRIRHDNTLPGAGWYLQSIRIHNEDTNQEWTFPCERWLAVDEDDGRIDRMLDGA
jgi:hypothetical protein